MTPQLRFPEFTDQWRVEEFNDIFERVTRKNKENNQNILTISAQSGLVSQSKFFSKLVAAKDVTNYYLLHKNDYAYNKSYSNGYPMGAIKRLIHDDKGVVSTLYICFNAKDPKSILFSDQYFEAGKLNTEIEKIAQEGARNHGLLNMSVVDFFKLPLTVPSIPEQQKIADYMGGVDSKLTSIQTKVAAMHEYKKGAMQALFSGKLRFKNENGDPYPDWEEKKLGDLGKFKSGVGFSESEQGGSNGIPFYKVSDMNLPGNSRVMISANNYVTDDQIKQNKFMPITKRSVIFAKVGAAIFLERKRIAENFLIDNNMMAFTPNSSVNFEYIKFLMDKLRLSSMAQTGALPSYNGSDIAILKVSLPSAEEQQKIANFLTALDDKVKLEEAKLASAKEFKKALLQRMFV